MTIVNNNKKDMTRTSNFVVSQQGKRGFTLLVSVVVTSMLLIISFVVANVAYKQLVLANSNQESQYAFYNADSGIECAVYWDFKGGTSVFNPLAPPQAFTCNGESFMGGGVSPLATTSFTLDFALTGGKGCVSVAIGKHANSLTIIDSKGYNTCTAGATRRLERGQTLTYTN